MQKNIVFFAALLIAQAEAGADFVPPDCWSWTATRIRMQYSGNHKEHRITPFNTVERHETAWESRGGTINPHLPYIAVYCTNEARQLSSLETGGYDYIVEVQECETEDYEIPSPIEDCVHQQEWNSCSTLYQTQVVQIQRCNWEETDSCWRLPDDPGCRRRKLLESPADLPCAGFAFMKKHIPKTTCLATPSLNPNMHNNPDGLSSYAHDWMEHTCCKLVTAPLSGVFAAVWLWKQVCTRALSSATDESYRRDKEWAQQKNVTYVDGPLLKMKKYCPNDLQGGQLNEWTVKTFYPVMQAKNPYYTAGANVSKCIPTKTSPGAVTVLLRPAEHIVDFGHISLVLHEDQNLQLPADLDTKHYVSFTTDGSMSLSITGSKARYLGFGTELRGVTKVITLHNADTDAMLTKWESIKKSGQMYDLVEWNCARVVMDILRAGFPECSLPAHKLMEPITAFGYIEQAKTTDVINSKTLTVDSIRSRHIYPPAQSNDDGGDGGIPVRTLVSVALASFLGTLVLVGLVSVIVICKIKGDAEKNERKIKLDAEKALEGSLARLLLSVNISPQNQQNRKKSRKTIGTAINEVVDLNHDGKVDFEEFSAWAKKNNLTDKQTKVLWQDLDETHNDVVTKDEWYNFVDKRPNLKFLVGRLNSARLKSVEK